MLLAFEQIDYTYTGSNHPAIANLSLSIPQGKRCALIGQNGCGKTTLFLLANGLYQPQRGRIIWQQQPLKYDRGALIKLRQQIGLVFQNPEQQIVATTVEEDISYGLYNLGLETNEIARRVRQTLDDFNLNEVAQTPIHHLSLGQKKRVSIADVMVLEPELLLLDEPTAYLDPRHTRILLNTLEQIYERGTTIVMATHDLDLVYRWADWVFLMDRGKLIVEGKPAEVFSQSNILDALDFHRPIAWEVMTEIQHAIEHLQAQGSDTSQLKFLQQQLANNYSRLTRNR
jgi:cobalt/nickel transport system ATP-binding protein